MRAADASPLGRAVGTIAVMDASASSSARGQAVEDGAAESNLYLPPGRLRRYQISKLVGAIIVIGIFTGWLVLRWYHLPMRLLTLTLLAVTVYITVKSTVVDYLRARGRQLAIEDDHLVIQRRGERQTFALDDLVEIQWREERSDELGLWFVGRNDEALAHLEEGFVQDQREARALLGWLRRRTGRNWPVRWP